MIFVEHAGKGTLVVVLVLFDEELIIILPVLFEDLFEEIMIVEWFELLRDGLGLAPVKSDIVDMGKDAPELICLFADDETKSKGPEEAIPISSYLPISIQSRIKVFF